MYSAKLLYHDKHNLVLQLVKLRKRGQCLVATFVTSSILKNRASTKDTLQVCVCVVICGFHEYATY